MVSLIKLSFLVARRSVLRNITPFIFLDVMKTLAQKEREKILLEEKFRLVNERNRIMEDMNEKEQMSVFITCHNSFNFPLKFEQNLNLSLRALEEEERLQTSLGANMSKVIKDDEKCAIM